MDPARIAAGMVVAIGLTAGIGDYPLAAVVTFLVEIILASGSVLRKIGREKD